MSGERTEKASEQKKKKSRERGEGPRSRDLTSSAAMLAALLCLRGAAEKFVQSWGGTFQASVQTGAQSFTTPDGLAQVLPRLLLSSLLPVAVILVSAFAAAVAVGAAQSGGIQVHGAALSLKWTRLNPLENVKGMFSGRALLRLLKSLLPAAAVVWMAWVALRTRLMTLPVGSTARLPLTLGMAYDLAVDAAWISLGWAALDYANEWRQWQGGLRMTKEEVKQEIKESMGNPQTKGRIRQIQRAMRRRRIKADITRAAVVITNPTHYAVALEFSYETMAAPKVLAKGRDLQAFAIREEARWAGVPIIENPPLARSLYRSVEEGQSIPFELYAAVAAILAFLFQQKQERARNEARYAATGYGHGYAAPPRTIVPTADFRAGDGPESTS
jgi:flagellar biosynthesis protein FlhB